MNHGDRGTTRIAEQPRKPWHRIAIHREVDPKLAEDTLGLDKVALHVDEQQRGMGGVDELAELGEDLLALNRYQRCTSRPEPPSTDASTGSLTDDLGAGRRA